MGNLCGKSSSDNFATPGRTVGSAPPPRDPNARSSIPSRATKPTYDSTPGRAVGGNSAAADARSAAAQAAEARASQTQTGGGKLSQKLAAQKKQTDRETLEQASRAEIGARVADAGHEARAYN